jgi:hypothetical protein
MKRNLTIGLILFSAFLASACSALGPGAVEQTAVAQNQVMQTEISNVRATATVEADRVMITLEYAQTAVRAIEAQNEQLRATLVGRNFDPAALDAFTPSGELAQQAQEPVTSSSGIPVTPGGASSGGNTALSGVSAAAVETPAPSSGLSNIVTATGVGADDCALSSVSEFTTDTFEIYAVATANNITSGTQIVSRWYLEGQEQVFYDWTPDFDIQQACIWFFMDQNDVTFTPGNWSVQFEVNGGAVGTPVPFSIAGEVMAEAMPETTPEVLQ